MAVAEILNLGGPPSLSGRKLPPCRSNSQNWTCLQHKLKCNGRFLCLFSDNRKEEQARKALEGALSGKKNEFDKWDKEIKRREELGGGGDTGGGGWFGWGRWFGWSNDDNFWQEAKQAILTILGLVVVYLLIAKGDMLLAVIFNPLLYALRGVRNGFGFISSKVLKNTSTSNQPDFDGLSKKKAYQHTSAKENVVRKWGSD
ncbi:hypothetical protein AAZX31_07G246700 [Glycine max]|uniref:Uncharacterized protein n=2 Tax=Glycine subgen. Soja TaxID=1462606 RepID=I1KNI8_SOYBN|nr:uncharacterized protein LOC100787644 [Glycine max]XP_028241905.1 uncharacterized protein LOC114420216 [Glycine soja]KAG5039118.1 hypothetical protein JHK86_019958 [Glycine max]KAG5144246.1 hypothetical protein JHK82_019941 [Glycine max]KAH1088772.1 hypothetical protein GYH30_019677 [Glycine max]KAH1243853.1 hypothetical protein GmHk_07G020844 [Glycine max]KHN28761.1 hypothetical protein glysoja_045818 [Glycine soja]|eukprot:XP_003529659.1 uncharacterized protein LOC100787644 [Glycine max]